VHADDAMRVAGDEVLVRDWKASLEWVIGNKLNDNDYLQLRISELYDDNSTVSMSQKMAQANAFENRIEDAFSALGVRYFSGRELSRLGGTDGTNRLTPDLMLLDDVEINGVPVRWIDAKNQFGNPTISALTWKLNQQWRKYDAALGPGAFIFNGGFLKSMSRKFPPGTILNDDFLRELETTFTRESLDGEY
jgi:hypothetical protein